MKRIIYKGKYITISKEKVLLPNKYNLSVEMVNHPGGIIIIPFLTKDKIVMIKQYRPVIKKYIYELPAGTIENNEPAIDCARREIVEEIGYSAGKMSELARVYPAPAYSTEELVVFKAEQLKRINRVLYKDEVIRPVIVTRQKVKQLFNSGKFTATETIAMFALCKWL